MKADFIEKVKVFKAMQPEAQARALSHIDAKMAELTSLRAALRRAQKESRRSCPVPAAVDVL